MTSRAIMIVCLANLFWLHACTRDPRTQPEQPQSDRPQARRPIDTLRPAHRFLSYYKLLARPDEYDGKPVHVLGVLSIDSEDNVANLYPSTESFRYVVKSDSLSLQLTEEQRKRFAALSGRFVAIEGTFQRINENDEYGAAGKLAPVTRLLDFSEYYPDKPAN